MLHSSATLSMSSLATLLMLLTLRSDTSYIVIVISKVTKGESLISKSNQVFFQRPFSIWDSFQSFGIQIVFDAVLSFGEINVRDLND